MYETPDLWRLITHATGHSIVIKSGVSYYFFTLKQRMRDYCIEKNLIVSEKFIDEQIIGLLVDSKASNMNLADIVCYVKNWIADIDKTTQSDYVVILPINQYHFRSEINTPHMKIVKITDKKIEDNLCKIPNALNDRFSAKELVDTNETDTFAIVTTRANDKESAIELSQAMVDRFVYAARLIDPNAIVSSRKNSYKELHMSYVAYDKSKTALSRAFTRLNDSPHIIQRSDFYDKFNKSWIQLLDFLFDSHPTKLQKSIIDALYWYGEVDVHRDTLVSQYLYCLIGLENLLVPIHERQKAKRFGKNAAIVLSGSVNHAAFYEEYYKKRNLLIHEGPVVIYQEDAESLRLWLRHILLNLVNNATKFIDLKSYYRDVHGIEWD